MPSEYPEDDSRTVPFQPPTSESAARRAPEPKTRYVDVPQTPERAVGPRNLAWGVIFLVAAFCAYWFALIFSGHNATRTVIASLGTFGLIWLFYTMRILRQRHGVFLALTVVVLFGAAMPLVERGFSSLDNLARERLSDEKVAPKLDVAPPAPPTSKTAPPAPVTPDEPPPTIEPPKVVAKAPEDNIVRELMAPPPSEAAKKVIEITEDTEINIGGRRFLIKKGEKYEFTTLQDGVYTFKAGQDTATVSSDFAMVRYNFKQLNELAQKEATRRYPALAEKFSEQYDQFLSASKDLRVTLPDYFKSPEWPLRLAEKLAAANGWKSVDELDAEAKGAKPEAPATEDAAPIAPPSAPDVPQENPLPPLPPEGK